MKKSPILKEFVEGRGYSREEWEENDNPPMTDEQLANLRPLEDVLPWLHDAAKNDAVKNKRAWQANQSDVLKQVTA